MYFFTNKAKIENELPPPGLFLKRRGYFKLIWKSKFLLKKSEYKVSWYEIFTSFLTVPILERKNLEKMFKRYPNAQICVRSIRVFEGDFDDDTFDWYHLKSGEFELSGAKFEAETVFLRGTKRRLRGLKELCGPGLNPKSFLIVESYAFANEPPVDLNFQKFSQILSKLSDGMRIGVSELLIEFKIATGNPYLKEQLVEPTKYSMQYISYRPFKYVFNLVPHVHNTETNFLLKPSNLNTRGFFEAHRGKMFERSSHSITYLLIKAIEQRFSGNAIISPILCHTVIENMIFLLEEELYKKDEVRPDKFKKRLNAISEKLNLNGVQLYLKHIYSQNVYEIRNTCAHEGKNISMFLADYSIWVTTSFVFWILELDQIKCMDRFKRISFPLQGHEKAFLKEQTRILHKMYGEKLERLGVPVDEIEYNIKPDVRF